MSAVSRGIDRIGVIFDDDSLVANAGLLLVATASSRLGLEALINQNVRLVGRAGGALPGRKVLTLAHAMVAGATHISHADRLRAGATAGVLDHAVMAPSTLGTFLRAFTFGHVRQLDAVLDEALCRAWAAGAGPGDERLVMDLDSTLDEVYGYQKHGAAYGHTGVLAYHPMIVTRDGTGEIIHARMRKGSANTARGARRFISETVARVRRAGATGEIVMRFDSGYWSNDTMELLGRLGVRFTMAVRTATPAVAAAISGIAEGAWVDIAYTPDGEAQVAETTYTSGRGAKAVTRRLIVRRTRLIDPTQQALWPQWRHHGFLTDLTDGDAVSVDAFHRRHATVELAIKDLKANGLAHVPSGNFSANGAWLGCAVLAHNLTRWAVTLGDVGPRNRLVVAQTIRDRLIDIPGRLVNHAGTPTVRLPTRWPWAHQFNRALTNLRQLRPVPT